MLHDEVNTTSGASNAPDVIMRRAEKIAKRQGCEVLLTQEKNGYHLYIPCPTCLHTHERRELADPKYSINLSMVEGIGEAYAAPRRFLPGVADEREKRRQFGSSVCMRTRDSKTPHRFSIEQIEEMGTVTERHPDILTKARITGAAGSGDREKHWEQDPVSGVMCPPAAGKTMKLSDLPTNHPAIVYLLNRNYDIDAVQRQFDAEFCLEQYPEGDNDIGYRRMPGLWCDTPQHRIIFKSMIKGSPLTWQARLIEKVSADGLSKQMLHPYIGGGPHETNQLGRLLEVIKAERPSAEITACGGPGAYWVYAWDTTHVRANPESAWIPVSPFNEINENGTLRFQPSKYRTAKYSSREMMGWDAAMQRAIEDPDMYKWVVLCEGPLDAARVGPGGIAVLGSSMSPANVERIVSNFHAVFLAFDTDAVGRDAADKIQKQISSVSNKNSLVQCVMRLPIPEGKDIGEMRQEAFDSILQRAIKTFRRNM